MVSVKARMRAESAWTDLTICNLSSRGLMARCDRPPSRGDYVEIRQRGTVIVARVVWSGNGRFGVRSQDVIDMAALLSGSPLKPAGEERRTADRPKAQPPVRTHAEAAQRSRMMGRAFEWLVVVGAGVFAATQLADLTASAFASPLAAVKATLSNQ